VPSVEQPQLLWYISESHWEYLLNLSACIPYASKHISPQTVCVYITKDMCNNVQAALLIQSKLDNCSCHENVVENYIAMQMNKLLQHVNEWISQQNYQWKDLVTKEYTYIKFKEVILMYCDRIDKIICICGRLEEI
jgi:hypothetical protein